MILDQLIKTMKSLLEMRRLALVGVSIAFRIDNLANPVFPDFNEIDGLY